MHRTYPSDIFKRMWYPSEKEQKDDFFQTELYSLASLSCWWLQNPPNNHKINTTQFDD